MLPSAGGHFVFSEMRDCFFDDSRKRHVIVLHGLRGAGKTQIALRFVEICQDRAVLRCVSHCFLCICIYLFEF